MVAHANVIAEAEACFAIATSTATVGSVVDVHTFGKYTNSVWSWTPGKQLYLNDAGTLSHVAGTHIKPMGVAITPTTIFLSPQNVISTV